MVFKGFKSTEIGGHFELSSTCEKLGRMQIAKTLKTYKGRWKYALGLIICEALKFHLCLKRYRKEDSLKSKASGENPCKE